MYLEKKHKCDLCNTVTVKQLIVCHALFLKSKETNTFKVTGKQKEQVQGCHILHNNVIFMYDEISEQM